MIPKDFRAWCKVRKVMMYNAQEIYDMGYEEHFGLIFDEFNTSKLMVQCFDDLLISDDVVVMQWTGLKDINNRKIYEDDIVEIVGGNCGYNEKGKCYVIKWHDKRCMFVLSGSFRLEKGGERPLYNKKFRVISNIYENPELIKRIESF
ncbi:MAG: YopX family protein [Promethearchaeota archaeon]